MVWLIDAPEDSVKEQGSVIAKVICAMITNGYLQYCSRQIKHPNLRDYNIFEYPHNLFLIFHGLDYHAHNHVHGQRLCTLLNNIFNWS